MSAMYFASYALIATFAGLIFGWAQWTRRENEGTPCKLKFLKVITGAAVVLWGAAGASVVIVGDGGEYKNAILGVSAAGIVVSAGFLILMMRIRKAYDERRFGGDGQGGDSEGGDSKSGDHA